jgi:hypothetical protein
MLVLASLRASSIGCRRSSSLTLRASGDLPPSVIAAGDTVTRMLDATVAPIL